jgi:hypothetical protein
MLKKRSVYFSRVDLSRVDNGGELICRNHALRVAETEGVELTISAAGPAKEVQTADFATSIGAAFEPIPFNDNVGPAAVQSAMLFEPEARAQSHVDGMPGRFASGAGLRFRLVRETGSCFDRGGKAYVRGLAKLADDQGLLHL